MPIQAATAELRSSRRWVMTMAILALILLGLWCLFTTAAWISPNAMPRYTGAMRWYFLGFVAQLTLYAYAAIVPFANLLRYARSLLSLREGDREGLARAIGLNVLFWRQCSYLMWGMVWLLVYLLGGGIVLTFIAGK